MSQQNTQLQTQKTQLQEPKEPETKRNRTIGIIAIAWLVLAGLGWFIFDILSGSWKPTYVSGDATEEVASTAENDNTALSPDSEFTLKALGDSFSGYAPLKDEDFQASLAAKNITLDYGDEPDFPTRAAALGEGKADLIFTSLDQYLAEKPAGKVVALLNQEEGAEPPKVHVAVASDELIESNPEKVQGFVDTYYKHVESIDKPEGSEGKVKFFNAQEAADWMNSGTLDDNIETIAQGLNNSGQEVNLPEDLGKLYAGQYVGALALANPATEGDSEKQADSPGDADATVADGDASEEIAQSSADTDSTDAEDATVADSDTGEETAQSSADNDSTDAEDATVADSDSTDSGDADATIADSDTSGETAQSSADTDSTDAEDATVADSDTGGETAQSSTDSQTSDESDGSQDVAQTPANSSEEESQTANFSTTGSSNLNVLGEVRFPASSAQLSSQELEKLKNLVTKIQSLSDDDITIIVQGHTSRSGSAVANQILSQARAEVVVEYLKNQNLDYSFKPEGFGYSQPIPDTDPTAEVNQRTVIAVAK